MDNEFCEENNMVRNLILLGALSCFISSWSILLLHVGIFFFWIFLQVLWRYVDNFPGFVPMIIF